MKTESKPKTRMCKLREFRDLTQKQLAYKAKLHRVTYNSIETGKITLAADDAALERIAKVLGFTVAELLSPEKLTVEID